MIIKLFPHVSTVNLDKLRIEIENSLKDADSWKHSIKTVSVSNIDRPLIIHKERHYQSEPFYFVLNDGCIHVTFLRSDDFNIVCMLTGMLVNYLSYNLNNKVKAIIVEPNY